MGLGGGGTNAKLKVARYDELTDDELIVAEILFMTVLSKSDQILSDDIIRNMLERSFDAPDELRGSRFK